MAIPAQAKVGIGSCVESAVFLRRIWIVKAALLAAECASAGARRNSSLSARYQKTSIRVPHASMCCSRGGILVIASCCRQSGWRALEGRCQSGRRHRPTASLAVHHLPGPSQLRLRFSPRPTRRHRLLRRKATVSHPFVVPTRTSPTAADRGVHSGPAKRRSNTFRVTSSVLVEGDEELQRSTGTTPS